MKLIRRIGISLGLALLVGGVAALLLFGLPFTGYKALTVPTGSMRPTIPPGSLVLMHRVPINSLKIGDVITYANIAKPGTTITHRIVKTYKISGTVPVFITKGDANSKADAPIVGGLIKGRTIWHVSHLGGWVSRIKRPYILLPIVYICALVIIFEEINRLNKYFKKRQAYIAAGYTHAKRHQHRRHPIFVEVFKFTAVAAITFILVMTVRAHALQGSNTVKLTPNRISVAKVVKPPVCTTNTNGTNISVTGSGGSNTTNSVNVSNSNNQSSSSGNATSTGGGTATSGSSSNTNCTTITVTIH